MAGFHFKTVFKVILNKSEFGTSSSVGGVVKGSVLNLAGDFKRLFPLNFH